MLPAAADDAADDAFDLARQIAWEAFTDWCASAPTEAAQERRADSDFEAWCDKNAPAAAYVPINFATEAAVRARTARIAKAAAVEARMSGVAA